MDTTTPHAQPTPDHTASTAPPPTGAATDLPALSRRGFLHSAAIAGGGLVAASVVACAPSSSAPAWSFGPSLPSSAPGESAGAPAPSAAPSMDHGASATPSEGPGASGSPAPAGSAAPPAEMPAG